MMDKYQYTSILDDGLHSTLDDYHLTPRSIVFQQDNDPKHKSYHAMDWMIENGLNPMPWPPNSPDMNIIENLWWHLEKKLRARPRKPTNIYQLFAFLEEEWLCIEQDFIDHLYTSMPHRVRALYEARGRYTKY
jgi:transposase